MNDEIINLLYVEDNLADITLFENKINSLQNTHIHLEHAENYEVFQTKCNAKKFDIYFVDFELFGVKNGLQIAKEIRQREALNPIILITDADQNFVQTEQENILINDHILKDEVTPSLLERVIKYNIANIKSTKETMRIQNIEQQSQKIQALGVLAGGVAHELNNLLHPISMAAENLLNENFKEALIQKNIEIIIRNAEKSSTLINNILNFSAIGGGEKKIINFEKNIIDIIQHTSAFFPKSLSIKTKISGHVKDKKANISINALHHVVTNLLVNAMQAMDGKGNIIINVECARLPSKESDADKNYFLLQVIDEGAGIPDAIKQKIFDPFFTTKETGQGTGLGLSIVLGVVEELGGKVKIADTKTGACFNIYIPVYAD